MRAKFTLLVSINAGLLLGGLGWLAWQRHEAGQLRAELAPLRAQASEVARLRAETARLVAQRVTDEELNALRADHAALDRLRAELAKLKQEAEQRVQHPAAKKLDDRVPEGPLRPAGEWRDLGRETPTGVFESVLAAARAKNTEALMPLLMIPSDAWKAVKAAVDEEPPAVREAHWPPTRFIAAAMAREMQIDEFQLIASTERTKDVTGLHVRLGRAGAEPREVNFNTYKLSTGWQLIVNSDAVAHYIAQFKAAQAKAAGAGK